MAVLMAKEKWFIIIFKSQISMTKKQFTLGNGSMAENMVLGKWNGPMGAHSKANGFKITEAKESKKSKVKIGFMKVHFKMIIFMGEEN